MPYAGEMHDEVDHVIGVAILREAEPFKEFLTILCRSDAARTLSPLTIPVAEKGQPHNHARPDSGPWRYEKKPDGILEVTPSVHHFTTEPVPENPENRLKTIFHNGGKWTVRYVCHDALNRLCETINRGLVDEIQNHWRLYPKPHQH